MSKDSIVEEYKTTLDKLAASIKDLRRDLSQFEDYPNVEKFEKIIERYQELRDMMEKRIEDLKKSLLSAVREVAPIIESGINTSYDFVMDTSTFPHYYRSQTDIKKLKELGELISNVTTYQVGEDTKNQINELYGLLVKMYLIKELSNLLAELDGLKRK